MVQKAVPVSDWRKQEYLKWLCTAPGDREPSTKVAFCETIGVTRKTLTNWENDADFLREWERIYLKTIGNPGRKQEIMDTLFATASDRDDPKHVSAAKEYFAIEGSLRPQKLDVQVSKKADELTDEQLQALLASAAQSAVERRSETADD